LEAVLFRHSDVQECAVVGIPDERWGEVPLAFVVQAPGSRTTSEELRAWPNERLGRQQRIARVELREELPRNANAKVLKNVLRGSFLKTFLSNNGNEVRVP
jgi:acyl-coenzyme A synthetase/AMP-(fatty) acid ligase